MTAVLLLGGTGEARGLAAALVERQIPVVSSLAGRVAHPRLPEGEVRIGGFGGPDGLAAWLRDHQVTAVVDATHPFARRISASAVTASARVGVPLLRVRRPLWTPGPGDRWTSVPDMDAAAAEVSRVGHRVFLTTGRQDVAVFAGIDSAWFLIRVVDPPTGPLPVRHAILSSRGPYGRPEELAIMREQRIDLLVTKNSGGHMTRGKLDAAAELGIRVVMVERPVETDGIVETDVVESVGDATDWVIATVCRLRSDAE